MFFLSSTISLCSTTSQISCKIDGLGGTQPDRICVLRDFLRVIQNCDNPETNPRPVDNAIIIQGTVGVGKTSIGENFAKEVNGNFVMLRANEIMNGSDPAKMVRDIYQKAKKDSNYGEKICKRKPYVIILDDIDDIANINPSTRTMSISDGLDELRKQISDNSNDPYIITILICNNYNFLDERLRSRCSTIRLPIPDWYNRRAIINFYANQFPNEFDSHFLDKVASATWLFTGRDIKRIFVYTWQEAKSKNQNKLAKERLLFYLSECRDHVVSKRNYGFMCSWFRCYCG